MESFEFNLADGFDRDEFFGNLKLPPQKLVLSLPDGTKVEMVNESQLREQIARGILEIGIPELPQGHEDNPMFKAIKTAQEVMRLRAADKARGNKE